MKRIALVFAVVASLLTGTVATAAVKAGATCSKAGSTSIAGGKKFTCIKSGKKLVWDKGVAVKKPTVVVPELPKPEPSPSVNASTEGAKEQDVSKLLENLNQPKFVGSNSNNQILTVQFNVEANALGGYVEIPEIKVGFKESKQEKDDKGLVTIKIAIPPDRGTVKVNVHLFAFSKTAKSGCCTGFQTEISSPYVKLQPKMQPIGNVITWKQPINVESQAKTSITPVNQLASINECKIQDAAANGVTLSNPQKHFVSGFGLYKERAPLTRSPIIQFVTVDFPDLQGKRPPAEDLKPVTDFLGKYWKSQTTNGTELDFRIPKSFIRMPKNVTEYELNVDFFSGKWTNTTSFNYVREAIKVADPQIDFSNVDVLVVAVPSEVTRKQIAAFVAESSEAALGQGFATDEKWIYNSLIMAGPSGPPDFELLNWAHELGHNFGLTDIRNTTNVAAQVSNDLGIYDLMNSMQAPELLAWNRFIIGVLNDDQVRCVTSGSTSHLIKPVEMDTKEPKLIVIPTGKYTGIAIESRRAIGFDAMLGSLSEGVLVYQIDTTIPYNLSPMKLVPRVGSTDNEWRRDAALQLNDSLTVQGWKISVIESGNWGDVVKVEKVG